MYLREEHEPKTISTAVGEVDMLMEGIETRVMGEWKCVLEGERQTW